MIRKLLICPFFGPLPEWIELWEENVVRALQPFGYDVLRDHDLEGFQDRVAEILGVECPIVPGEGKIHDYRCAFGLLYADELQGFDMWGHTDFDMVYGRITHFLPDQTLARLDQFSNHPTYVSGPLSLYRNDEQMATLFQRHPDWRSILEDSTTTGWVEKEYSELVFDAWDLRRQWSNFQTRNLDSFDTVHFDGDRLMEGNREVMVAHFRRTKEYPEGCK